MIYELTVVPELPQMRALVTQHGEESSSRAINQGACQADGSRVMRAESRERGMLGTDSWNAWMGLFYHSTHLLYLEATGHDISNC